MSSSRKLGVFHPSGLLIRIAGLALFAVVTLPVSAQGSPAPTIGAAAPQEGYVGSEACSRCHQAIYKSFSQTSMGRSMSPVGVALPANAPMQGSFTNPALNRRFEVYSDNKALFQSEAGIAADGTKSFESAHRLEWVIGAGDNGFGTILRNGNFLFQAPLSYYAKTKSWAPSPGYEAADLGFNRPILPGCIFCHSGRPNSIVGSSGQFQEQPFAELAIGCERCHGPGSAHIQAMHGSPSQAGKKPSGGLNSRFESKIVNPADLSGSMADNICMACHQTGDARVLKPGKSYQDVRPGQPLDDVLSILMVPPTRESPPAEDHVQHYYSMTLSKCYRASEGRMRCITCHDPHVQPTREEAPAYFAAKCMTCHTDQSCKLPAATRAQTKPANNCIGCHMPKRDIQVISHSSATNHRIIARPDEPFPDVTFRQTTAELPDLIHLNPAPQRGNAKQPDSVPKLTLLQAYAELAQNKPEYVAAYLKVLGELEKSQPDDPLVQAGLGRRDMQKGDFEGAVQHLERVVASPNPPETAYSDLAEAYTHLGQTEKALPLMEKVIALNPFNPLTQKSLVVDLIALKQFAKAHEALQRYMETFPQDDFMRQMLARVEGKGR